MTYPEVSENAPVPELYVIPVVEFEMRLRMYDGVSAVVDAYAVAH